jgi:hydrogenase expression/formation protein HypC
MCLATLGKIEKILDSTHATVNFNGVKTKINLSLITQPKKGEWVMVHAGFAIEKTTPENARGTLKLLKP